MSVIKHRKVEGALRRPKGVTNHSNKSSFVFESYSPFIAWPHPYLVISTFEIRFCESLSSMQESKRSSSRVFGKQYLTVILLMAQLSTWMRQPSSFWVSIKLDPYMVICQPQIFLVNQFHDLPLQLLMLTQSHFVLRQFGNVLPEQNQQHVEVLYRQMPMLVNIQNKPPASKDSVRKLLRTSREAC